MNLSGTIVTNPFTTNKISIAIRKKTRRIWVVPAPFMPKRFINMKTRHNIMAMIFISNILSEGLINNVKIPIPTRANALFRLSENQLANPAIVPMV
ncbi:hypothetical protein ES705_16084 [subsurface metagenome]